MNLLPLRAALLAFLAALPGLSGAGERAGSFDHYVLALSWNASWCEAEGDRRRADQCDPRYDHGFLLHGLWPQHQQGWPEYCETSVRDPSRSETGRQADLFGSGSAAWYQWKKHGRCSGLSAEGYFEAARDAYDAVRRPELLRRLDQSVRIDPDVVEQAFLEANPELAADGVVVTCRGGLIREVRICLDKALAPRACTAEVADDACRARAAELPPMR